MTVHAGNLALLAGELCLDFTNTIEPRAAEHPHEFLLSYTDLVVWGRHTRALTLDAAERLHQAAGARPEAAGAVLVLAISLRESIYRIFAAILDGLLPAAGDLDVLNAALGDALARQQIVADGSGFRWAWQGSDGALDQMLWPVVRSAGELLTSERVRRLIKCPGCGWLLLDSSRNHSRRWCDMRVCGNRAKARRHYERQRTRRLAQQSVEGGSDGTQLRTGRLTGPATRS